MALADDLLVTVPRSSTAPAIAGRVILDGVWYGLRFAFNVRDRRWYLDVSQDDGTVLAQGVACVAGVALLGAFSDARLPAGQLYIEDSRRLGQAPGRHDWTDWARLYYRPAAVVAAAAGTDDEVF